MKRIIENRASSILYNVIVSNNLSGKKILLPANVCPIVPATLLKCNVEYEFVDISSMDYLMDREIVKEKIKTEDIAAIIFVRTYGYFSDETAFFRELKYISPNIVIIDDRSLCVPQLTPNYESYTDLILYSTGYSKYVDLGYGGYAFIKETLSYESFALDFNEKDHDNLIKQFKYNLDNKSRFNYVDTNWLDNRKCEIDEVKYFEKINKRIQEIELHKNRLNEIYETNLPAEIQLKKDYNNWRFNILVNNKKFILKKIFENDLFASSHYQSLVGIFGKGIGENANNLHSKVINLFNDFRLDEKKAYKTCEIINKYYE